MLRLLCISVGVILLVACGGGEDDSTPTPSPATTPTASPETHRVSGKVSLNLSDATSLSQSQLEPCAGKGGYDDIREGGAVTVRDGFGAVIATTGLNAGIITRGCVHIFNTMLPQASFYSFEVTHRGEITYSYQEMEDAEWKVAFRFPAVASWTDVPELVAAVDECSERPDHVIEGYWGEDGAVDFSVFGVGNIPTSGEDEDMEEFLSSIEAMADASEALEESLTVAYAVLIFFYPETYEEVFDTFTEERSFTPLLYQCVAAELG